ncbi:MAG: nucleotidyl transferase AbiEii/AbiGii toxin family protein [Acidobacteria bacterium]|nr:nucleotidyl transferase AbiEii/AbiGii toxin family protein [Acidobacteriota bacterium]MBI3423612.1 nucleotidyl transferase AbiEii/AbiGii toxin family protein [Acidobacteriota bacterium]
MTNPNLNDESLTGRVAGLSAVARATIRRQSSPEAQSISTDDGLAAALQIAEIAQREGVACALAGGIAMHLYGFTRATTDVDLIAAAVLSLEATRNLTFGGVTYPAKVGERVINVDWIVRDDDTAEVYQAALADAVSSGVGLPVVTPEWLVIMKKLADRGKDYLDLLWLLRQDGLVDRDKVAQLLRVLFGRGAYWPIQDMKSLYLEADLMRAKDERDESDPASVIKS